MTPIDLKILGFLRERPGMKRLKDLLEHLGLHSQEKGGRVLDRRLQALRKADRIEFSRADGWRVVPAAVKELEELEEALVLGVPQET